VAWRAASLLFSLLRTADGLGPPGLQPTGGSGEITAMSVAGQVAEALRYCLDIDMVVYACYVR
jgi:hypothetical protein